VASYCCADHRSLRSFPTRRSSDLQLHLLAGAGGQLVAGEHHRCTGTVGPFAADLGITHAGGEAHTGELDVLDILDFIALEVRSRSEEHTSELQSRENLVCRLLLEK